VGLRGMLTQCMFESAVVAEDPDYYEDDYYDDRVDVPGNGEPRQEDESVEGLGMIFFKCGSEGLREQRRRAIRGIGGLQQN